MVFGANIGVPAKLPPSINRLSNMDVYTEIIELFPGWYLSSTNHGLFSNKQ